MAEDDEPNPFSRPGFIAAAMFVVLLVVLGIAVVVSADRDDAGADAAAVTPTASVPPTRRAAADDTSPSVCGLVGEKLSGTVSAAPRAIWKYQGTVGYPMSSLFGPGQVASHGARSCFQHSPLGALFMAANAFAQSGDRATARVWGLTAVARGPYRDQILAQATSAASDGAQSEGVQSGPQGVRLTLAGFRVLDYAGTTARVDLAVKASVDGQSLIGSYVYELVWQDGDWKISSDVASPLDFATIPDTAGYVPWGA